mmetsp:Transcript_3103/g.10836  ORF Transcript_3103/g.10836 Transcript_3103/m.10836 type:complete len:494 (+) Transcript_3103:1593-3074(+)
MFWFVPAASKVSRFKDVAKPDEPPAAGAAGPKFVPPPAPDPKIPACPASKLVPPAGFMTGMDCAWSSPPPTGGSPGGAGGRGTGVGGAPGACAPKLSSPPDNVMFATPATTAVSAPFATLGSSLPSLAAPRKSAASLSSCARSGCACGRCGTAARCWQYCGHSWSLCLNCSSASEPKANIFVPNGFRTASSTHRSATPRVTLATSWWSIKRPKSTAVTLSSFSGYLGKNRYSSNRLCTMHAKTSRSRALCDARNVRSISTVRSTVLWPEYRRWKLLLASASTSEGKLPPTPVASVPLAPPPPPGVTAPGAPVAALKETAASVGCALAAAAATPCSSCLKSGGRPPAPACSTLKKMAMVSTASFGAPGVTPASSPVARARRNRKHAAANGAPLAAARSCNHISRLRYSRLAARAASSTARACGARASAGDSAFRSWHTSSILGTEAPPSRSCVTAMALATHVCPAFPDAHMRCNTAAAFVCAWPCEERNGGRPI